MVRLEKATTMHALCSGCSMLVSFHFSFIILCLFVMTRAAQLSPIQLAKEEHTYSGRHLTNWTWDSILFFRILFFQLCKYKNKTMWWNLTTYQNCTLDNICWVQQWLFWPLTRCPHSPIQLCLLFAQAEKTTMPTRHLQAALTSVHEIDKAAQVVLNLQLEKLLKEPASTASAMSEV